MQINTEEQINHEVTIILLKKIIELLNVREEPLQTLQADEVRAALRNELSAVIKSIKDLPDNKDIIKELKTLTTSINKIEFNPSINVAAAEVTIPEIKVPDITIPDIVIPDFNIPTPQVNYTAPDILIPAPIVNVPAAVINMPEVDLDSIVKELQSGLKNLRTNNKSHPLAVRLSDGGDWIKELRAINEKQATAVQYMSDVSYIKSADGTRINPATEESAAAITRKYAIKVDTTSTASTIYVGKAAVGTSSTSTGVWQMMKVDTTSGAIITWADGNILFDNIYDNRTSLTYV